MSRIVAEARKLLILLFLVLVAVRPVSAAPKCLTNEEIDAKLGNAIRSKSLFIDTSAIPDIPLCSGLTLAQRIQQMRDEAFPEEVVRRNALQQQVIQSDAELQARRDAESAQRARLAATSGAGTGQMGGAPSSTGSPDSSPLAGPALTRRLDALVLTDSRGWAFNRYDAGSMRDVRIVDGTVKGGHYVLRGVYSYNGGARGWVLARMSGSNLECIQFHDSMIGCRALRTAAQGQMMRGMAAGAVSSLMSGNSGGATSGNQSVGDGGFSQQQAERASAQAQAERDANAAAAQAQHEALQHPNSIGW